CLPRLHGDHLVEERCGAHAGEDAGADEPLHRMSGVVGGVDKHQAGGTVRTVVSARETHPGGTRPHQFVAALMTLRVDGAAAERAWSTPEQAAVTGVRASLCGGTSERYRLTGEVGEGRREHQGPHSVVRCDSGPPAPTLGEPCPTLLGDPLQAFGDRDRFRGGLDAVERAVHGRPVVVELYVSPITEIGGSAPEV